MIVGFIDDHRDELGVEPICTALQIAPSTYYAAKRREVAPSARVVRNVAMMQVLMVLWVANQKVYGAHKLWNDVNQTEGRPDGTVNGCEVQGTPAQQINTC